jgi:hypothetical protein
MPHSLFSGSLDSAVCGGIEVLSDYTVTKGNKIVVAEAQPGKRPKRKGDCADSVAAVAVKKKKSAAFNVTDIPSKPQGKDAQSSLKAKKKKKKKDKPAVDVSKLSLLLAQSEKTTVAVTDYPEANHRASPEELKTKSEPKGKGTVVKKSSGATVVKKSSEATTGPQGASSSSAAASTDLSEWRELFVCEEIVKALAEQGFSRPTPIQKLSLPAALQGENAVCLL